MHNPVKNSGFGGRAHCDILRVWDPIGIECVLKLVSPRTGSKLSAEFNIREYLDGNNK